MSRFRTNRFFKYLNVCTCYISLLHSTVLALPIISFRDHCFRFIHIYFHIVIFFLEIGRPQQRFPSHFLFLSIFLSATFLRCILLLPSILFSALQVSVFPEVSSPTFSYVKLFPVCPSLVICPTHHNLRDFTVLTIPVTYTNHEWLYYVMN